jgi:hypothetical protein
VAESTFVRILIERYIPVYRISIKNKGHILNDNKKGEIFRKTDIHIKNKREESMGVKHEK